MTYRDEDAYYADTREIDSNSYAIMHLSIIETYRGIMRFKAGSSGFWVNPSFIIYGFILSVFF